MAASVHRQVANAIKTALAAMTVAGGYHYDYNATDQVKIGMAAGANLLDVPTIYIALEDTVSTTGPELNRWARAASFRIEALIPSDESPGSQQLDAMDALDDIMRAIEADRSLGLRAAGVRDVLLNGSAFSGSLIQFARYGVVSVQCQVKMSFTTGA